VKENSEDCQHALKLTSCLVSHSSFVLKVEKCKVLHVGYNNMCALCASYFIGNTEIQSTDEERDLRVIVHKSLKVSSQCNKVVREAYSILGVINRCFLNKTNDILVPLLSHLFVLV